MGLFSIHELHLDSKTPNREYHVAFAALMLTVAAVFWQHLFTSDVLFFRDIVFAHYPRAVELSAVVRAGQLPLWNPFEHFGEPVVVNPNYLLFYPTTWLTWVLPPAYGFKLHYVLHFFLLAAGSFLLARRIGLSPFACYVAGAVFVFSGPVMSLGNFYNMLPAVAWMPLAVLAADYQMQRGGWRGGGLLAASLALQFFAGEPLTSIATTAIVLGWMVAFYGDLRAPLWTAANRLVFRRFVFAVVLALGLSAIQLFPALRHAPLTGRAADLTYERSFFWSLHPLKFLEILCPEFWGNPLWDSGQPWLYMDGREPYLLSVFIGLVVLTLALVAVLARSDRPTRFWMVAGMVALLLALGRFTSFSNIFYYLIPFFRIVRFPVKLLLPVTLAVAQLAALGMEYLLAGRPEETCARRLCWVSRALLALGLVWLALAVFLVTLPEPARRLAGWLTGLQFDQARVLMLSQALGMDRTELLARATDWAVRVIPARAPYVLGTVLLLAAILGASLRESLRRRLLYCAIAAGIFQLVSAHNALNPLADRRFFENTPPVMRYLETARPPAGAFKVPAPARIFAEPLLNPPTLPPLFDTVDLAQVDFLPAPAQGLYVHRLSLQAAAGLLGVENTFTADPEHILVQPQQLVNNLVYLQGLSGEPLARLLRLASVQYALLRRPSAALGLEYVGTAPNATTHPVQVYRVRNSLPRVYLVHEALVLPAGMPTIHRLPSYEFDPARQVVLEEAPLSASGGQEPPGEARLLYRDALRVEVAVTASGPAYLVLTDSYHPDWQVSVNGKPTALLRANQMFRAAALPAGTHRVVFRYRPVSLLWGAAVSLATAVAIAFLAWRQRRLESPRQNPGTA